MICVTIGRGRHKMILEEWKEAAEAGAELVELRIDCLRREPDLKRILAERHTPVVFTIRRGIDGGLWRGDEEKRQRIFREAIVLGVDYVDLEEDIAAAIPRYGKTKRIISHHALRKPPDDLPGLAASMKEKKADIIKIAVNTHSFTKSIQMLDLAAKSDVPTIAIAMGEVGFFTRILGAKYGAPFTYAGFNPDRIFAAGMPFFQELRRDYFYDQIDANTQVYAVIGDPIAQSFSPAIHNAAFRQAGLNNVYLPILVPTDRLGKTLTELTPLGIRGFSVTIPHKEEIVHHIQEADDSVKQTGSCNTVVVKDGKRSGFNTDYRAAMQSLEEALGGSPDDEVSMFQNKQVLILGAGGVARTIAVGAAKRGAGVAICNRHDERAAKLAETVGCRHISWAMRAATPCDVLINCTPVGMHPKVDDSPVPAAGLKAGMLVFDTVYHPENTMLLKLARERDCKTITGIDMFVRQAAAQFRLFTGQDAPTDLMRDVVKRKLGALRD